MQRNQLRRSIFTRISAVVTLVSFLITCVGGNFADSAAAQHDLASIIKAAESFIPFSAGKVSYAKNFSSKDVVINIQDLHCHGETQKNIAVILSALEKYGFDKIYLEGAVEDVSTSRLSGFEKSDLGNLIIEDMVSGGSLSGAEYYSVKSGKTDIIKALDKNDIYFENIILLGDLFERQPEVQPNLDGLKSDISKLKKEYYNSDLLRLKKVSDDFAKDKISAKKYYAILGKLSKKAGININAYTNVEKYINLISEKSIDYRRVSEELQSYISALKTILPYTVYQDLAQKSGDFSKINDIMPVLAAISKQYDICGRHKLKQLDTFFNYINNNNDLNPLEYVSEEDSLLYDIGISLSLNKYERDVVFLDKFSKTLEGFFTAKITAADYGYFLKHYGKFEETAKEYLGPDNEFLLYFKGNSPLYKQYHSNNLKRDNAFLKELSCVSQDNPAENSFAGDFNSLKSVIKSIEDGAGVKVVITGGFHSEGLKKRLSEQGISLIIITPNISGNIEQAEKIYSSVISEYARIFTSAIAAMPYTGLPMQKAVPDMVAKAVLRAKDGATAEEIEKIINEVFEEDASRKSFSMTKSVYEPVNSASVKINSINESFAEFTVTYKYGESGFYSAKYVYDFKSGSVLLTVDEKSVETSFYNFFDEFGNEAYSPPSIVFRYGQFTENALSPLMKELTETISPGALILMSPENCHSTVASYPKAIEDSGSKLTKTLSEPSTTQYLNKVKETFSGILSEAKPFKAKLTGHFKLMPDGFIIYQIDNPAIIENIEGIRKKIVSDGWNLPKTAYITIGRLSPGKYSQKDLDEINKILEKYNADNPLSTAEYDYNTFTYGQLSATGNKEINTETIKMDAGTEAEIKREYRERLSSALSDFGSSTRFNIAGETENVFFEASGVSEILEAIPQVAAQDVNGYEIIFDSLLPDNYSGRSEEDVKRFKRKIISRDELYEGVKNIRDYMVKNGARIKQKAAENNVFLSLHAFSLMSSVLDSAGEEISINPHPAFNDRMKEIFTWQLDIAQAIGVVGIVVHIENYDIEGYADFVKEAARRKITVNFENHLKHSDKKMKGQDSFYYHTLLQGFIDKEGFVDTMLAVKSRLTEEERQYLGITLDTSKALNSYLRTLPVDADEAEIRNELAKITLENLIEYYEAIENAGLTINNMHLAQFSAEVSDVRVRTSEESGEKGLVIYNKSNVEDLNNPKLDMAKFLSFLKEKKYKGVLNQETPGLLPPASILNEKFKGNKFYKHFIAPVWEEGLFRFVPFAAAVFASFSPLGIAFTAAASIIFFASAHVIANKIIKKEKHRISFRTLNILMPSVLFTAVYVLVSAIFPASVIIQQLVAFLASTAAHIFYSFNDSEEKRAAKIRRAVSGISSANPITLEQAEESITNTIRIGNAGNIIESIFAPLEGFPQGTIRGISDEEAELLFEIDSELAKAAGINKTEDEKGNTVIKGFGYVAFASEYAAHFERLGGLENLIKKHAGDIGITAFTDKVKTVIHNIAQEGEEPVFLTEQRDANGFLHGFTPAFCGVKENAPSVAESISDLAESGSFPVYVKGRKTIIDLYDSYDGSLFLEYTAENSGESVSLAVVSEERESKDERLKGFKKVYGKAAAKVLGAIKGKETSYSGFENLQADGIDEKIARMRALSEVELREKFSEGINHLKKMETERTFYFFISDSVRQKIDYSVKNIVEWNRNGLNNVAWVYENNAKTNFSHIDKLESEYGLVFEDLILYAIILNGAKDVRKSYAALERLHYSLPMISPEQFLRLVENIDLDNLNLSMPYIIDNIEYEQYTFSSSKLTLFLHNILSFLNTPKTGLHSYFKQVDKKDFDKSFEYLMLNSLNRGMASREDVEKFGSDTYIQELFSTFYTGKHSIKDSVASENPSFHNLNDARAVREAYSQVFSIVKKHAKAFALFKSMKYDDFGRPLTQISDEEFEIFADEIASGLFQYISVAERRYGSDMMKEVYSAVENLRPFRSSGIEFKLLGRTFSEIKAGTDAGDCTAPGQINFGKYVTEWFPDPNFESLNVYIDGKFALKFHLVISEDEQGNKILVIDALETSPLVRIEPKVLDEGEPGFQPETKDLDENFSSVTHSRDKAFAEALKFISGIAEKQGIKNVYLCDITNSPWLSNNAKTILGNRAEAVKFKDMDKYQSGKSRKVAPVEFESIVRITEKANGFEQEFLKLEEMHGHISSEMTAQNPDALKITALLRAYLTLIHSNFSYDSRHVDDDALPFLVKNQYFNRLTDLMREYREVILRLDYSAVDNEVKLEITKLLSEIEKISNDSIPKRKKTGQAFFTDLIFASDNFIDGNIKFMSDGMAYGYVEVFGERLSFKFTEKYFFEDENALNVYINELLREEISAEKFKKLVSASIMPFFFSRVNSDHRVPDSGSLYGIMRSAVNAGIIPSYALINEVDFGNLPEDEKTALTYAYMLFLFDSLGIFSRSARKMMMANFRGFSFYENNIKSFESLSEKGIMTFVCESNIQEVVLNFDGGEKYDLMYSYDKDDDEDNNLSLGNRITAAAASAAAVFLSVSAIAFTAFPVAAAALALLSFFALVNYSLQSVLLNRAASKAGFSENIRAAHTDGEEIKIEEGLFKYLPSWYRDMVVSHERMHVRLNFIKNRALNEILVTLTDLFTVPYYWLLRNIAGKFAKRSPLDTRDIRSYAGESGFIGNFRALLIDAIKENENGTILEGLVANSGDDKLKSVFIEGAFKKMPNVNAVINRMLKQSDDPSFRKVLSTLKRFLKANPDIKYFEFDEAFAHSDDGGRESIMDEIGGFAVDRPLNVNYPVQERIVALRSDLSGNELALIHELLHLAVATYKIKIKDLEAAITDEKIIETLSGADRTEKLRWQKEWKETKTGINNGEFRTEFAPVAFDLQRNERTHYFIRAFQTQYFPQEDEALTVSIRNVLGKSREIKIASIAAKQIENIRIIKNLTDFLIRAAEEYYDTGEIFPEPVAVETEELKAVSGRSFLGLTEYAGIDNKKMMKFGKEAVKTMDIKEGDEIYFFTVADNVLILKTYEQVKSLRKDFIDSCHEMDRLSAERLFMLFLDAQEVMAGFKVDVSQILSQLKVPEESMAGFYITGSDSETAEMIHVSKENAVLLRENEKVVQAFDEYVRMIGDIIIATDQFYAFDEDFFHFSSVISQHEKHKDIFISPLKVILERMLQNEELNNTQKAFALFLLRVISDIEGKSAAEFNKKLENIGSVNAKALLTWLTRYYDSAKNPEELLKTIKYIENRNIVRDSPSASLETAASAMIKLNEIAFSARVSENERFLLEAERELSESGHNLYGSHAVNIASDYNNIDMKKMISLRDFGVKPVVLSFGNFGKFLCNVTVSAGGKTGIAVVNIGIFKGVPVISVAPESSLEITAEEKTEFIQNASAAVMKKISDDFVVKGRFAVESGGATFLQKIICFFSNESLLRKLGSIFNFDVSSVFFDGADIFLTQALAEEAFPSAAVFDKNDDEENVASADSVYYDAEASPAKQRNSVLNILKRVILSKKQSEIKAGAVIGETINAELFCGIAAHSSPVGAQGLDVFGQYFEKRMGYGHSPIAVLENFTDSGSYYAGNAALIDWNAESFTARMVESGVLTDADTDYSGMNINEIREKSLETAEKILSAADSSLKKDFEDFIAQNPEFNAMPSRMQFAQFILSSQLKSSLEAIHKKSGRAVIGVSVNENTGVKEIAAAAFFWQKAGFDGIRLDFAADSYLPNASSFLTSLSMAARAENPDFMIITALPSEMQKDAEKSKNYITKASSLGIISALSVDSLADSLKEHQLNIWVDINPLDEKYRGDTDKYFSDITKAVEFGAGYLGIAAGSGVLSADGASTHIEVIDRIKNLLSLTKTKISAHQAYKDSYKMGISQAKEIKAGMETIKVLVRELIKLQDGKPLTEGAEIDEKLKNNFLAFVRGEPSLYKNAYVRRLLDINDSFDVYRLAGFLRGAVEEKALESFRKTNGDAEFNASLSEILRGLVFIDTMIEKTDLKAPEDEFVAALKSKLGADSSASLYEIYKSLIEQTYGQQQSFGICDYAAYMYLLRSGKEVTLNKMTEDMVSLMKAYLSEINFGYGSPVESDFTSPESYRAKIAVTDIMELFASASSKPKISSAAKVSINTVGVSMMLKAA